MSDRLHTGKTEQPRVGANAEELRGGPTPSAKQSAEHKQRRWQEEHKQARTGGEAEQQAAMGELMHALPQKQQAEQTSGPAVSEAAGQSSAAASSTGGDELDARISHESGGVQHAAGGGTGASHLTLLDVSGAVALQLSRDEAAAHDVQWLKQRLCAAKQMQLQAGEELLVFTHWPHVLEDKYSLASLTGASLHFQRWKRESSAFNLYVRCTPRVQGQELLALQVVSEQSVRQIKDSIEEQYKVPRALQRLACFGVTLEDDKAIEQYKLPAECTITLDVLPL